MISLLIKRELTNDRNDFQDRNFGDLVKKATGDSAGTYIRQ